MNQDRVAFWTRRALPFLTWGILLFAAISHFISPKVFIVFYLGFLAWSVILLLESIFFFILGKRMVSKYLSVDWERKCKETSTDSRQIIQRLVHLIIVPNYKEEVDTLVDTLQILSEHYHAKKKYIICLAMEEAETGSKEKADLLSAKFRDHFKRILVTYHPNNLPGETRGKGPNVSFAVESCKKTLSNEFNLEDIMVTVQDADTHFVSDYFSCLTYKFSTTWDRTRVIFAPPISFYGNALEVPAAVRVTDMVWTTTVLNQLSTGRQVKFPCSCYSLSMDLCHTVGYWDKTPEAIGEDAHMFLKCLFKTDGMARTETIYIPAGCYNVCDETYLGSIAARYNQMYRHLWGTFDLAYICHQSILRGRKMKLSPKLWAFYEMFKVRVIPSTLTITIAVIPGILKWYDPIYTTEEPYTTIFYVTGWVQTSLVIPYLAMAVMYELLHMDIVRLAISRGCSTPSHRRKFQHFLLDWFIFPFISLFFFMVCSLHVCAKQMFTDNITYVVAKKPSQVANNPLLEEVLTGET
jgi:hypothetical protein